VPRQIQKLRLDKPERRFRLECNFMKIIRAMIASAVLMILCSCATHAAVRPSLPAETFFNKEAGRDQRIYLTLHLENGGELLFIADTGASDTVLTGPWSRFWENVWEREKFIGWEK
jgi:predicted aspartyl protease